MQIQKIRELAEKGEIATPAEMSRRMRISEAACLAVLEDWHKVYIEKQSIYIKEPLVAKEIKALLDSGNLTNVTKRTYDTGFNRKIVKAELERDWDSFTVGKRSYYVKRDEK